MADGTSHQLQGQIFTSPRLGQALAPRSSLWARCRCGREAAIDPGPWMAQGLSRQAIVHLEERLRCLCGIRCVRLETRGLAEAPRGVTGGIYIFR
jgi:hypothetical protein